MKKTIIFTLLLFVGLVAQSQNVHIDDYTINPGSEAIIKVYVNNVDSSYIAQGFVLQLPDGFSIVHDDLGKLANLDSSLVSDHKLGLQLASQNRMKVAIYSLTNSLLAFGQNNSSMATTRESQSNEPECDLWSIRTCGNMRNAKNQDHCLISFRIKAPNVAGSYTCSLNSIQLVSEEHVLSRLPEVNFTVVVPLIKGDINGDGIVNIVDVTTLIDILLSSDSSFSHLPMADINGDGVINIVDMSILIDTLLSVDDRSLVLSKIVNGTNYMLYSRFVDGDDKRVNGDGTMFYKMELSLDVINGSTRKTVMIDDSIYHTKDYNNQQQNYAMLFDLKSNQLYVFCNSKAEDQYYGMHGFGYTATLGELSFRKESVFTTANWGWWPYFEYIDGRVYLHHFSFAGYYSLVSVRYDDGSWSLNSYQSILPEEFEQIWEQKERALVIE